jgi:hypothetical protein
MLLFPTREGLVSDIPAGDGKITNLFSQCAADLVLQNMNKLHVHLVKTEIVVSSYMKLVDRY